MWNTGVLGKYESIAESQNIISVWAVMLFDWHCPLTARRSSSSPRDSLIRFCLVCLHLSFPLPWLRLWSEPKCVKAVIRSQIVVLLCLLCFAVCAQMFLFFFPQTHSARVSSKAKRANNSTSERETNQRASSISSLCLWEIFDRERERRRCHVALCLVYFLLLGKMLIRSKPQCKSTSRSRCCWLAQLFKIHTAADKLVWGERAMILGNAQSAPNTTCSRRLFTLLILEFMFLLAVRS